MTSVRLTETQLKKIKKYHMSKSEFIRRAVDYYIIYLENPYNTKLLDELETWIQLKRGTSVTHMTTNVPDNNTNVLHMSTTVPDNNTDVINNSTDVLICNTNNKDTPQKTHTPDRNNLKQLLSSELPMLQRQLKNPANIETIPDATLKMLSKKYDISKSTVQAFIIENKNWIKDGNFRE